MSQALSYAQLAGLPPINGLYSAILPAAVYSFFGSSMQLCVGPVALVSLLQSELISKYNITPGSQDAVEFAGECAIAVGLILTLLSLLNCGDLIRFISHPVMSGFTTAAAMLIGQNQLKGAFGFISSPPQAGQTDYEWNWQVMKWYTEHWNDMVKAKKPFAFSGFHLIRNFYATRITFALYFPMIMLVILKQYIKPTPERKKSWVFLVWTMCVNLMPFAAIIIGAHVAYTLKQQNEGIPVTSQSYYIYNLSIVHSVKPGLDFVRLPKFRWAFGTLLGDVIPTALIAFMESWGVAQRVAGINKQSSFLNASQEMWSIGCANFLAGLSSAYPVAGSFSRSSLNQAAGATTPLSKMTTMLVIVITLRFLTDTFFYIPNAALSAVIWVAIYNLVSVSEFYEAWKHNKKDFLIMLVTATTVYVSTTGVGLAVGIGLSVLLNALDQAFNSEFALQKISFSQAHEKGQIVHLKYLSQLNFLTIGKLADEVKRNTTCLSNHEEALANASTPNDRVFLLVSNAFETSLKPKAVPGVPFLPTAMVLDLEWVRTTDLTALLILSEKIHQVRKRDIKFVIINSSPAVASELAKFHIVNDSLFGTGIDVKLAAHYMKQAGSLIPIDVAGKDFDEVEGHDKEAMVTIGEMAEMHAHDDRRFASNQHGSHLPYSDLENSA